MFISEFIKILEEFQDDYGEVQVLMRDADGNEDDFDCFTSNIFNPFDGHENIVVLLEM